jgi:hypothetical protein
VAVGHRGERARLAGDVDDPARRAPAQERGQRDRQRPGAERVDLERRPRLVARRGDRAAGGVDAGVVDEHVEPPGIVRHAPRERLDAGLVGDVEHPRPDVEALVAQARGGALARAGVARRQQDGVAAARELARHLQADAAVRAGDDGDPIHGRTIDAARL